MFLRHDAPCCKILINPEKENEIPPEILKETLEKKIPVPQYRPGQKRYAPYSEVYGTAESPKPALLPTDTSDKKKDRKDIPLEKTTYVVGLNVRLVKKRERC